MVSGTPPSTTVAVGGAANLSCILASASWQWAPSDSWHSVAPAEKPLYGIQSDAPPASFSCTFRHQSSLCSALCWVAFRIQPIFVSNHSSRYHLHRSALHPSQTFQIVWLATKNFLSQDAEDRSISSINCLPFTSVEMYFGWYHKPFQWEKVVIVLIVTYARQLPSRDDEGWGAGCERLDLKEDPWVRQRLSCKASSYNLCQTISTQGIQSTHKIQIKKLKIQIQKHSHEACIHNLCQTISIRNFKLGC